MEQKPFTLVMLSCLILLLTGCGLNSVDTADSGGTSLEIADTEPVSESCRNAMKLADTETNFEESEQLLIETLSACQTADEWMKMLKTYPGAIGVTDESFVTEDDFVLVCWDDYHRRVCQDAIRTGRMPDLESEATGASNIETAMSERILEVWFQWIPQEFSTEPAVAHYLMVIHQGDITANDTGEGYITPSGGDEMPSMDSGAFFTKTFTVAEGDVVHAVGSVPRPPNEGRISCLILDIEAEQVLDYQEGAVGSTDPVECFGYTHDNHSYIPGVPPVDVEFG